MNQLVYEFLQKTNNDPHKAYDEYIKYHLLSGNPFPKDVKGITDFIKASKPEEPKKVRKPYVKKVTTSTEYKMTIEDVVKYLKQVIKIEEEQLEMDKKSKLFKDHAMSTWSNLQQYKIMLCKIIGVEYVCIDIPDYNYKGV